MNLHYLPPVLSTLFRIDSYIFLRIIPARIVALALPALYLLYLLSAHYFPLPPPVSIGDAHSTADKKANGLKRDSPPKGSGVLTTLCFSLQTHNLKLKLANIVINTIILASVLDFTLTPFFDTAQDVAYTRIGAVYSDGVKIQVRYPVNKTLVVLYREASHTNTISDWKMGPTVQTQEQRDWVETVRLIKLWPSTKYEYTVASLDNSSLPFPEYPVPFRTFPDRRLHSGRRFRFIASSCLTPNFPYRGHNNKNTIRGFDLLADYLGETTSESNATRTDSSNSSTVQDKPSTDFLLLLGDFIYADVPVFIGDDKSGYQRLYRRNYQSPSFRKVYQKLPIIHIYDDHEVINNYAGNSQDIAPYANGSAAYDIYAGTPNYDPLEAGQYYFSFHHGDVAFFVLDTRRYRSIVKNTEQNERTMLGETQLTALYKWIGEVNNTASFKFIVSSVPFTSLWSWDGQIDSWAAYAKEKAALLEVLQYVPNVVIISGDRHEFAVVEFNPSDAKYGHIIREVSTSPLSMFYVPFFRTLQSQSAETFTRNVTNAENVTAEVAVPYERTIAYLYKGFSKWSTFELDTRNSKKPVLRLETVIDGKPSYHLEITGSPLQIPSVSLGSFLPTNFNDLFDKIGWKPSKWF